MAEQIWPQQLLQWEEEKDIHKLSLNQPALARHLFCGLETGANYCERTAVQIRNNWR